MSHKPLHIAIMVCIIALTACLSPSQATKEEADMSFSPPLVIAHRGASSLAPENTLAAARKALEIGADLWELDVSVTADGELILMHDDTLERTCNARDVFPGRQPWQVWDFTLAEVQTLDCGSWFNKKDPFGEIRLGNVSEADQQSYVGEPAPTLRQALEFTRDHNWRVNVELKKQPNEELDRTIVGKAVALVEELGMDDGQQVVISSFRHDYLETVKNLNPRIPTQAITSKAIRDLPVYLDELGADTCNPKVMAWSYKRLGELAAQGIAFNVWTVDDELTMKALIKTGVSGIITNYPQTLVSLLKQR
ncbi:MAG: glycerophosphodiester phosphodiesterase [Anaerolineae bacterium]|nr:MAG: glycerophosphodiester phosphodiesterase [Anaerolineae bacterium]